MKKKFTLMMAVLALLTFLAVPMGMRGQTRSVTYELATSISAGDVVLLVAEGNNYMKELSGFTTTGTIYGTVADFTTTPNGVYPLTVVAGSSNGSFAFKNSENKYLSWSSGNSLQLSETLNNSSSWTFNYAYTVTTITNVGTTARQIKYNSSSPRFACYTSAQQSIKLYKQVNSSLLDSDLALTGAPVALSFDLFNNTSAQTVNFTTSSTGDITVSQSDYITATVDANNKTITVTPVAVTNGTQTITVSQAATDTYDAGSVTFTVEVADSTPATTVTIDDSGITNTDVYVSTAAGSLSATVTSGDSPVSGAMVTWSGDNDDVATIASDGTVILVGVGTVTFTATYAGASGQYVGSSATYEMIVTSSAPYVQPTTIEIIPNYTFWGKTGQFSGSTFDELDGSQDNVSLHWTRGSGSTYANTTAMRFYKDNNLTFTAPEGFEITSIELTVSGTYNDLTFDPTGFDNETTTWTGSSATVTMSRPSNASSYATISKFTITLASSGSGVTTTTTINVPQDFNMDIYQGETAGTLTATVTPEGGSALENPAITWSSSNTDVATIDANGEVTLVAVGATTITASYAGVEDEYKPSTSTYELTVTNSNAPGTQNNPYTVAQAIANTPSSGNVYIQGVVSSFYNTSIVGDGSNYRYYISDDGTTTTQLLVYKGKGLNEATFTNADDLLVGDEVTICGSLTTYQNAPEVASGNYLYSWNRPTHPIIIANDINLAYDATSGSIAYSITNPTSATLTATSAADWISNINVGSESVTFNTTANEGDADRSATITLSYTDAADKVITVTQAHYVPDYATLPFAFNNGKNAIEETNGLTQSGLGSDYADENTKLKFDSTDDYVILKINERPGTLTFNIKGNSFSGGTFTVQTSEDGVNYTDLETYTELGETQSEEFTNLGENIRYIKWIYTTKVSGNVGLGNITIAKQISGEVSYENLTILENETYVVSNGGILTVTGTLTNTNPDNLIIEDGGQLITPSTGVKATFKKTTTASTEAKDATNNWYAISSPVNEIAISTFAAGTHNVYSYIEKSHYWNEYRGEENTTFGTAPFTNLENGRGYLYRSTASGIDFKGDVNIADATYTLSYTPDAGNLAGFHLIGNPFSYNIYKGVDIPNTYLEDNFYTLTPEGGWELGYDSDATEPTAIKPNTGILVQAQSTADGQTLTIAKTRNGGVSKYDNDQISFKVENSDYYDVACVQFKDGRGLNKIEHRNAEIPMLYIMNNGENFGAANMPDNTDVINLGFEAKTMGQYTISLKAEGQYSYMHLVDKLTGNDIDMLVEDSYTFVGTPNDRNDRFVLRLNYNAAGIDTESDIFAYQSGNEIIISGEGELQVFDITGRKVMTTDINGVETINGMNRGVYIFRLNEKTQKIVVR